MARALTLALSLLLSIHSAFAQYVTVIAACTRDVTSLCDAAKPERNFLTECVESHFQDFHERCRGALVQTAAVREACKSDIEQQCPGARPGAGRILLCVKKTSRRWASPARTRLAARPSSTFAPISIDAQASVCCVLEPSQFPADSVQSSDYHLSCEIVSLE